MGAWDNLRMYALFEDAGKFLTGRVLSEAEASAQVELDTGKRVKVKSALMLIKFDQPSPADLMREANALAQTIELDLAWEFAPTDEFGFADLAREYFSANASLTQQAATLLRLFEAPHYFRRAGRGRFKKAAAEVIQQALVAIDKKKQQLAQIDAWAEALGDGQCPEPVLAQMYKILFKPDKNGPEYKAVVQAARATQLPPLALLQRAGAITSAYEFHWQRFLFENFPKGTLGIHIAAPGLALQPGDAIDQVGRQRLSTVYMPGHKITMLPDGVVQHYTLQEGRACPALSLYVQFDANTLAITDTQTRLEQVPIAANLRHDQLDDVVTPQWLDDPSFSHPSHVVEPAMPRAQLAFLHRLARHLKAQREVVRGKPETFNRPDYNFRLQGLNGGPPCGQETVDISVRQRGAALDLIVAEAMILANSTWGQWMASLGVPAIYRSQASLAPGIKVRMGTKALPHAGIGVPCYAWSTSPLRRYTDLVNQWQLIACVRHGATAALAAPFKPKDAALFSIISAFEETYSAYNAHQASMERFWTLQWLRQHQTQEIDADVIKAMPGMPVLARAQRLPLVLPIVGGPATLARGQQVRLRLGSIDDISLDVPGQFVSLMEGNPGPEPATEGDEEESTGTIAIAVDLNEADGDTPAPTHN